MNLCEILKGQEGEYFYSPCFGKLRLDNIENGKLTFEILSENSFVQCDSNGIFFEGGKCCVFPIETEKYETLDFCPIKV